jgi:hypothetical protein
MSYKLLAIVAVEPAHRIRCQQPHCGHSVYARIHIVEEAGQLIVLGSDCFAKRYGVGSTSNFSGFGGGGGRPLTQAERELLLNNTAALLAQFEKERAIEQERIAAEREALRQRHAEQLQRLARLAQFGSSDQLRVPEHNISEVVATPPVAPVPSWAELKKPKSSFFAYCMEEGQFWVLMQSATHDGCFIAPAPTAFESWDEALPPNLGTVDAARNVYISHMNINDLIAWFSSRCRKGSRIDSDAVAIHQFTLRDSH